MMMRGALNAADGFAGVPRAGGDVPMRDDRA